MAQRFDRILVVDAAITCWDSSPPVGEVPEVIAIEVCALDLESLEPQATDHFLVRPKSSTVSESCTERTALTADEVAGGLRFRDACARLVRRYHSRDRIWASYGDHHRLQFEHQCQKTKVPYPFGPTHMNVQSLLALMQGLKEEITVSQSFELLGLPAPGEVAREGREAHQIATVLAQILTARRSL